MGSNKTSPLNNQAKPLRRGGKDFLTEALGPPGIRDQQKILGALSGVAVVALIIFYLLIQIEVIVFNRGPKELMMMTDKLTYVFQWMVLPVAFYMGMISFVATRRSTSLAIDPLSGNEKVLAKFKNVLNNTHEHLTLTVVIQLAAIAYYSEETISKLIPFMNISFFIGRITYVIGYPTYRGPGFIMSILPSSLALSMIINGRIMSFLGI